MFSVAIYVDQVLDQFHSGLKYLETFSDKNVGISQLVGFEPTLPEGNSFRVSRLNHSATTADLRPWHISTIYTCFSTLPESCWSQSIVGSVVECSPATRAARVRFPDDANLFFFPYTQPPSAHHLPGCSVYSWGCLVLKLRKKVLETRGIDPRTSHMLSERSTI